MTDRELMQQVYQYLTGESVRNKTTDKHIAELISEGLAQPEQEPLTVEELKDKWNAQADQMNHWGTLGYDEMVEFAQAIHGIGGKE